MKTKIWTKPKLVVLVKGRPEEAVLQLCKRQGVTGQGGQNNCGVSWVNPCQSSSTNPS
jgi:hypothetical protein